jgi:hypothetical protein
MPQATRLGLSSAQSYGLELNGVSMGLVKSFAGGNPVADVGVHPPLTGHIACNKFVENVRWGEIVLTCGADMSQPFYDWLTAALNQPLTRRDGAVVAYDYNMVEVWRLNFSALVSEVGFPALDASSKDAATLCVKLAPQRITKDTNKAGAKGSVTQNTQKSWLLSNFSLNIDGLDCRAVSQIEAMTVIQPLAQDYIGTVKNLLACQQVPNLVLTLRDESGATDFDKWAQSFLIEGNHTQDQEKNGTLEFLGTNLQDVLFTLQLRNLGIIRLAPVPSSGESVSRIQAEMYCEQMLFSTGGSAVTTTTTAQPGASSSAPISLPTNLRQLGVAATGMQMQATPRTGTVTIPRLPTRNAVSTIKPSQGPTNLNPVQRQPVIPRAPTLRFRNLSSTPEIT